MEHTKEPWSIGKPPPNGEQTIGDSKGLMVAVATTGYGVSSEANARRIVACVNACVGVGTEYLEDNGPIIELVREHNTVLKQRDELLAALNLWKLASDNAEESELDDMACYCMPMPLFCDADEATDAAIASAKESK